MNDSIKGKRYKKNSNIVSRFIDEEIVLVPVSQKAGEIECIYTLNESGAYIWNLIDGKLNTSSIIKKLTDKYQISEEKACADLREILEDLKKADCIEEIT